MPTRRSIRSIVQLAVGGALLLAEVTRDAVERLQIAVGTPLHALVKSVSIGVTGVETRKPD